MPNLTRLYLSSVGNGWVSIVGLRQLGATALKSNKVVPDSADEAVP